MQKSLIIACATVLMTASLAHAQATRTWVSGDGDDALPCSRTAPCKTFAGAISKTVAGGYIQALDPGGFGTVSITKSITIDGGGEMAGSLSTLGGSAITVNSASAVVILRNLSLEGAGTGGNGIRVIAAAQVHVENSTIQNFTDNGILFAGDGDLFVTNTSIKQAVNQSIYVQRGRATLDRVTMSGGGFGLLVGSTAVATARNSTATGNEGGFGTAYSASAQLNLENCVTSHNRYGVLAIHGSTVRMSEVNVSNNTVIGLYNDGASFIASFGNNRLAGNAADGNFTSLIAQR